MKECDLWGETYNETAQISIDYFMKIIALFENAKSFFYVQVNVTDIGPQNRGFQEDKSSGTFSAAPL